MVLERVALVGGDISKGRRTQEASVRRSMMYLDKHSA